MNNMDLSVVLPAYNASSKLRKTVEQIILKLNNTHLKYEIIIAEDGSKDGTYEIAEKLTKENNNIIHLHEDKKLGRGGALSNSFRKTNGKVVLYTDVDLEIPLDYLDEIITPVLSNEFDVSIAAKRHPLSETKSPKTREIMSLTYNFLVRKLLKSKIYCHQTGMKAFNREIIDKVLPHVEDKMWFWDTEIIVISQWMGYKINQVPVKCGYAFDGTTVNYKDSLDMFFSIFKLRSRRKSFLNLHRY